MLRNIGRLQQLGIISLDVALRQMTGGRYYDFSKAITVPHYMTTPELSPHIGPEMHNAMELQAFILSIDDYLAFDEMIIEWNRNESRRERVYTYVDPRRYDWRKHLKENLKRRTRTQVRLRAKPPIWIYCCATHTSLARLLRDDMPITSSLQWDCKNGLFVPVRNRPS